MSNPFEKNTMGVIFALEANGELTACVGHNFDDNTINDFQLDYYLDVINGIKVAVENEIDGLAHRGFLVRSLNEALSEKEEESGSISFEPSDELLDAVASEKVVQFDFRRK